MTDHRPEPLIQQLPRAPGPFELFLRLKRYPYAFFLDSALGHARLGRFSFIGCDPFLVFTSKGDKVSLKWAGGAAETLTADPFTVLRGLLGRFAIPAGNRRIPFVSGAVGYFSYDLKGFIEDLPDRARDDLGMPDCALGFYDTAVVYDHRAGKAFAASTGLPSGGGPRARERLNALIERLARKPPDAPSFSEGAAPSPRPNFTKSGYMKAVAKAKEYIRRGDIYQVNLSQRFEARLQMPCDELYRRLRTVSPAPFAAYLDFGDVAILSSSPERFLLKKGDYVETRPIKGTRPRRRDRALDRALERELAASPKDAAEHIMIVDLERNDLGRICRFGTVKPTESAIIERYANVFHLVSTVSGTLRDGVGPVECLRAAFPGGSITGAPKIRSMEIIEELEPVKRSIYTGAIGYIGFDGNMDTSIAIRTFIVRKDKVYFQVGGGIVADSDPGKEYEETLDKARGLMEALGCVPEPEAEAVPV